MYLIAMRALERRTINTDDIRRMERQMEEMNIDFDTRIIFVEAALKEKRKE